MGPNILPPRCACEPEPARRRDRLLAEANLSHELAGVVPTLCGFAFLPSRSEGLLWRWRPP